LHNAKFGLDFNIMHSFAVISANIAINDISLKLDSVGYISAAESIGVPLTTFK